jgi:hypothetical protein
MSGVVLQITHAEVAARTCEECKKWMYRDDGSLILVKGKPMLRPAGVKTPCITCPKCIGTAKTSQEGCKCDLSNKNLLTIKRYYEHLAAPGPVDDIMRRNFGVIRQVIDGMDRVHQRLQIQIMAQHGSIR